MISALHATPFKDTAIWIFNFVRVTAACHVGSNVADSWQWTWVTNEVFLGIRRTGQYLMPMPVGNKLMLLNETDLHYSIVAYLMRLHPNALIVPGLGELWDTFLKRSNGYRKRYKGGQPDFIIGNLHVHYYGFTIKVKTPKGNGVC